MSTIQKQGPEGEKAAPGLRAQAVPDPMSSKNVSPRSSPNSPSSKRKLSDCVAELLVQKGVRYVFAISGGASLHLIHSIAETKGIDFICPQHEQAGAMAADGYSRVSGAFGCALATSGPGVTNLVTGIAASYYDSVPVLYLTGQVATFRDKSGTGVRQYGFQETDTVDICKSITKYAVTVRDPSMVLYELEKALRIAKEGRPGPVLVDIPDDIQRMAVDPAELKRLESSESFEPDGHVDRDLEERIARCAEWIGQAQRPILVLGWGIHLAGAEAEVRALVEQLRFPVAMTWAAQDLLPFDHPCAVGGFGTHGVRYANFAVQNADLVVSVGCRLDTKATGSPASSFARGAKIVMVDIDPTEATKFDKFGLKIDLPIHMDAGQFLRSLRRRLPPRESGRLDPWWARIRDWKKRYPACLPSYSAEAKLNPYVFVQRLSRILRKDDIIFSDTGCALAWMMQGFQFKEGQRFFHAFNYTPMGYGLPGAIGGAFAKPGQRIILVTGDGSLQMNVQELATVVRHQLPIKMLLINNHGHSMVQQTQEMWLGAKYYATSIEGGLAFPDWVKLAQAYGFPTETLERNDEIDRKLETILDTPGAAFLNIEVDSRHRVIPQVQYGRPNEDAAPLLDRKEFLANMIVPPLRNSLKAD